MLNYDIWFQLPQVFPFFPLIISFLSHSTFVHYTWETDLIWLLLSHWYFLLITASELFDKHISGTEVIVNQLTFLILTFAVAFVSAVPNSN